MRSLFVVLQYPVFSYLTDFRQLLEKVEIEHFVAARPVEPFDVRVLGWRAGFDELQWT